MDLNNVSLTGRLAKDAETKLTEFTLAVGYATKDEYGEWKSAAHFFDVKLWGNQGA